MNLVPFSKRIPGEFLNRDESNFDLLVDKINLFYSRTRDRDDTSRSRRKIDGKFCYRQELMNIAVNFDGVSSNEIASEVNEMLEGCIRHQDPTTAFNIIPAPLLDVVAGLTLLNLYNPNTCWDFISGKLCLFEKKVVRMLGKLVGWNEADGFVITGGKQALLYAIKNGMGRASANEPLEMSDYVVLCSELAHYSIEHVCHYLGLSKENCIRVPADANGEMNISSLEKIMTQVIRDGKQIATIIAVGGATVNLIPDPIKEIKETIDRVTENLSLQYTPYLHVDSVISWAWLSFLNQDISSLEEAINTRVKEKVFSVLSKIKDIELADSFAADFHKTGFCPYAAGVFITKDSSRLTGMYIDPSIARNDCTFSELEVHKQTLENSRSAQAILSTWIALRKMGLKGLQEFLIYQLNVCETFKKIIRENYGNDFEVLNEHTNGWEIVLKPKFGIVDSWNELQTAPENLVKQYSNYCQLFINELWNTPLEDTTVRYPVIGFVKKYSRKGLHEKSFPTVLIHPTSLHYDNDTIIELLRGLIEAKRAFERNPSLISDSMHTEINLLTPPR